MIIRAVLWDMGGVVLRTEDQGGRRKWEQRLGLAPDELARIVFDGEGSRKAVVGRGSEDEMWAWVMGRLGLPEAERQGLVADFFGGDRVDHRLVDFIRSLRPGVRTGMITNAWPNVRHFLENEWRVADAFDHIVISAEVGIIKPDPRIYRLALDGLGVAAAEAVFVDDMPENVAGAEAVGMRGIRFITTDQAISDVRELMSSSAPSSA